LLYGTMLAISLLAAVAAARIRAVLARPLETHAATTAALAVYIAVVAAAASALPGVHEVPAEFPATTLWRFREASVGLQLTLWTVMALVFGYAAQRVMTGPPLVERRARGKVATAPRRGDA
jgi:Probable cobalt transporter subunit (CbtA)